MKMDLFDVLARPPVDYDAEAVGFQIEVEDHLLDGQEYIA